MDRAELIRRVEAGESFRFLPFYGHTPRDDGAVDAACLSQWYEAPFAADGETYRTAEHWMMAEKARRFGDRAALAMILRASSPREAKAHGRAVTPYDDALWAAHRVDAVVRGNLAKFSQHEALRDWLLATGERVLVEAAPRDTVWGVGLGRGNPAIEDPRRWRGQNLLGFALMRVRDALR